MDYNTLSARESLTHRNAFGDPLKYDSNFVLKSPFTFQYNCIAFAMGMKDRWVDSSNLPWHWWPASVNKSLRELDLINAFRFFGFEECGMDDTIDADYDKVALYHNSKGWTHAARIVEEGIYHSKFGASYDGTHSRGDVLFAQYGTVFIVMRRLKSDAHLTDDRKGVAPGVAHSEILVMINGVCNHVVTFEGKTYLGNHGNEVRLTENGIELL